jgi:hypothetical protein
MFVRHAHCAFILGVPGRLAGQGMTLPSRDAGSIPLYSGTDTDCILHAR